MGLDPLKKTQLPNLHWNKKRLSTFVAVNRLQTCFNSYDNIWARVKVSVLLILEGSGAGGLFLFVCFQKNFPVLRYIYD